MKKYIPAIIITVVLLLIGVGVLSFKKSPDSDSVESQESAGARLVINQLDQSKRPFTVLSGHTTNKLLALYLENTSAVKGATVDLEYLSGDLLKGARSTLEAPINDPFVKAFLLGSCSAGGKCSFDKELISGSLKLKLSIEGESDIHVLKADYSFVEGETTTIDGRLTYTPAGKPVGEMLLNTLGLPEPLEGNLELYPIAITSISQQAIKGQLEIRKKGISKAMIYTGSGYQELEATITEDTVTINLAHSPRKEDVEIIRDDLKGAGESHTFYILGPIVLLSE